MHTRKRTSKISELIKYKNKTSKIHPKSIPKSSQKHPKSHPKIIPKSSQNHPKIIPKSFQNHSKTIPKSSQNHTKNHPKILNKKLTVISATNSIKNIGFKSDPTGKGAQKFRNLKSFNLKFPLKAENLIKIAIK